MNLLQQIANSLRNLHGRQANTEFLLQAAEIRGMNLALRLEYLEDRQLMADEIMRDVLRIAERAPQLTHGELCAMDAARDWLGELE